jgi:SAM-dependent methyltransferase
LFYYLCPENTIMAEGITKEWFTCWFNSRYYDILYKDRDQTEADTFIHNLVKFLNPAPHSFMLDLACGKGRHAISLGKMGYNVTGIDISDKNIHSAETSARRNLEFYIHDMRKPFMVNYYDYVFNLFTSFGYFDNERENQAVITNIYNALKPNGVFVLDFVNIKKATHNLSQFEEKEVDGVQFVVRRSVQDNFLIKNIEVTDGAQHFTYQEKVYMFTPETLSVLLEKQGFEAVKTFGDYNLSTFTPATSDRFILISKKK